MLQIATENVIAQFSCLVAAFQRGGFLRTAAKAFFWASSWYFTYFRIISESNPTLSTQYKRGIGASIGLWF
jgi:hypothetical protein